MSHLWCSLRRVHAQLGKAFRSPADTLRHCLFETCYRSNPQRTEVCFYSYSILR